MQYAINPADFKDYVEKPAMGPEAPQASLSDIYWASARQMWAGETATQSLYNARDVYQQHLDRVGKVLPNEKLPENPASIYLGYGEILSNEEQEPFRSDFDQYRKDGGTLNEQSYVKVFKHKSFTQKMQALADKYPEHAGLIMPPSSIDGATAAFATEADTNSERIWARSGQDKGPLQWSAAWGAYLAGQMGATLVDAPNLMMMLAFPNISGAKGFAGLAKAAAKAGAYNAAGQAALEPFIQAQRAQSGLESGISRAAQDIAGAALFGAAIDLPIRAGYRGVQRWQGLAPVEKDGLIVGWEKPGVSRETTTVGATQAPPPVDIPSDLIARARADTADGRAALAQIEKIMDDAGRISESVVQKAEAGDPAAIRKVAEVTGQIERPVVRAELDAIDAEAATIRNVPPVVDADAHTRAVTDIARNMADPRLNPAPATVGSAAPPTGWLDALEARLEGIDRALYTPEQAAIAETLRIVRDGDPVEIATMLRDHPEHLTQDLNFEDPRMVAARSLLALSPEGFVRVEDGRVSPKIAALVADYVTPEFQLRAMDDLSAIAPRTLDEARAAVAELLASPDYATAKAADTVDRIAGRQIDDPYGKDAAAQTQMLERKLAQDLDLKSAPDPTPDELMRQAIDRERNIREAVQEVAGMLPDDLTIRRFSGVDELPPALAAQVRAAEAARIQELVRQFQEAGSREARLVARVALDKLVADSGRSADAFYLNGEVWLATYAANPKGRISHESVHHLVATNRLTPDEMATLAAYAREAGVFSRGLEAEYAAAYKNRAEVGRLLDEEAVAHLIEAVMTGTHKMDAEPIQVRTIIGRLVEMFRAIRDALLRRGAIAPDAEPSAAARALVRDILSGEVAKREAVQAFYRGEMTAEQTGLFDVPFDLPQYVNPVTGERLNQDQVLAILDQWRSLQGQREKAPQNLTDFLMEGGQLRDQGGEITNLLGGVARYLINDTNGQMLDDAALRAWEAGFIPTAERPSVAEFLDYLGRDLGGDRVFRQQDAEAVANRQGLEAIRTELDRMGLADAKSERDVLRRLETSEPMFALKDYQAEQDRLVESIKAGNPFTARLDTIAKSVTFMREQGEKNILNGRILSAATQVIPSANPERVTVSTLTAGGRIVKIDNVPLSVAENSLAFAYRDNGHIVLNSMVPLSDRMLLGILRHEAAHTVRVVTPGGALQNAERVLGSREELQVRTLWDRLAAHAETLKILDRPVQWVYKHMDPDQEAVARLPKDATVYELQRSVRQLYDGANPNMKFLERWEMFAEESVAFLVQLDTLGAFTPEEIAPFRADLDAYYAAVKASSLSRQGPMFALNGQNEQRRKGIITGEGPVTIRGYRGDSGISWLGYPSDKEWMWATDNPKIAKIYGRHVADFDEQRLGPSGVYGVEARFKNALIVDAGGRDYESVGFSERTGYHVDTDELAKMAKRQGYDGLIIQNVVDPPNMGDFAETPSATSFVALQRGTVFDSETGNLMFALRTGDQETGRSMRRDLDVLGYYSAALEAAKGLKQAKGTPEQMLQQILKTPGVKASEIEATKLKDFLEGKKSVTRDEIVQFLTENRVRLNEVVYAGQKSTPPPSAFKTPEEFANWAVSFYGPERAVPELQKMLQDYQNPRYADGMERTRARLVTKAIDLVKREKYTITQIARPTQWVDYTLDPKNPTNRETVLHLPDSPDAFRSGHFPEPNIVGHTQSSMVKHEGKPTLLLHQVQSDFGQRIRDGGVRDEAKIAELKADKKKLQAESMAMMPLLQERGWKTEDGSPIRWAEKNGHTDIVEKITRLSNDEMRVAAELQTAEASVSGHPLVNTTDQWVNTTLRRALTQAVEADADYIAIPHGDTVLSYNPGDDHGMRSFYGTRNSEGIVPKNFRKIVEQYDKEAAKPIKATELETSSGVRGYRSDTDNKFDKNQTGFTLFPLTDTVKQAVRDEGLPMFAFGGERAKTADHAALAKAKQMEAEGPPRVVIKGAPGYEAYEAHRRRIWNETSAMGQGWFRGVEGKWKFEIDDSGAALGKDSGRMSSVLRHDDLFAAYPDVGKTPVKSIDGLLGMMIGGGYREPRSTWFGLSKDRGALRYSTFYTGEDRVSKLLHEGQHAIQTVEDMARGGNQRTAAEGLSPSQRERLIASRAAEIEAAGEKWNPANFKGLTQSQMLRFRSEYEGSRGALARAKAEQEINALAYNALAGEVEARAVEKRLNMTPEERKARPPWLDYDVPEDQQIVRGASGPMFALNDPRQRLKIDAAKRKAELEADLAEIETTFQASGGDTRSKLHAKRAALLTASKVEERLDESLSYRNLQNVADPGRAFMLQHQASGAITDVPFKDVFTSRRDITEQALQMMGEFAWMGRKRAILGDAARKFMQTDIDNVLRAMAGETVKDETAKTMAQGVIKTFEWLRQRFNAAGGDIQKLEGWFAPQFHDADALMAVGKQKWIAYLMGKDVLDRARMLDRDTGQMLGDDALRSLLSNAYDTIITGGMDRIDPATASMGKAALYKKGMEHRVLHFKDADAWIKYQREMGGGDLYAAIIGHVEMMARDIAAMEAFGANPSLGRERIKAHLKQLAATSKQYASVVAETKATFAEIITQLRETLLPDRFEHWQGEITTALDGVLKTAGEINKLRGKLPGSYRSFGETEAAGLMRTLSTDLAAQQAMLMTALRGAAGTWDFSSNPWRSTVIPLAARATQHLEDLRLHAEIGDLAMSHKNPMSHVENLIKRADDIWAQYTGASSTPVNREFANALAAARNYISSATLIAAPISALSDQSTQLAARWLNGLPVKQQLWSFLKGFTPADKQLAMHLGLGLEAATSALNERATAINGVNTRYWSGYIADRSHTYSLLGPMTTASKVGFALDWSRFFGSELVGKDLKDVPEWTRRMFERHGITAGDWRALSRVDPTLVEGRKYLTREDIIRDAGIDVAERYMTMFYRESTFATLDGSAKARTLWIGDTKPGTTYGEFLRSTAMLKAFPTTFVIQVLGRQYSDIVRGRYDQAAVGVVALTIVGTLLGATAVQLKNLIYGRELQDMSLKKNGKVDPTFWVQAYMQGGGAGVVGDLISSATSRTGGGLAGTMMGPMFDLAGKVGHLAGSPFGVYVGRDEKTNPGREAVEIARRMTPGMFVPWYVRNVYERMVLDELQRVVDPEAYKAFEAKKRANRKLRGTDYFYGPGDRQARTPNLNRMFGVN